MDHNQQNSRTLENVYVHGSGSGGCLCLYWHLGPRVGNNQSMKAVNQCTDAGIKIH